MQGKLVFLHVFSSMEEARGIVDFFNWGEINLLRLVPKGFITIFALTTWSVLNISNQGFFKLFPGWCNVNEDRTPPSPIISLRKGKI